jgi:adenylyltransferase/sulfurtransferase
VRLATPLRKFSGGKPEINVEGKTIEEVIYNINAISPGFKKEIIEKGKIKKSINIYVNKKDVRSIDGLNTKLNEKDIVTILPPVSGGKMNLNEIKRYSRQLVLPDFGSKEQRMLKNAKVAIAGAGALGCPSATYLALAGVGKIDIIDMDMLEITNLNRQFLYRMADLKKPKAEVAANTLREINPEIEIKGIVKKITYENAFDLLKNYDAVIDGTDNFPARYAINDACAVNKVPLFHGAVLMHEGRVMSIIPGITACFRCAFPEPPPPGTVPTCREAGVFGALTGIIGSIQAFEAIRHLAGKEIALKDVLLVVSADSMEFEKVKLKRRNECSACGRKFVAKPVLEVCE